MKLWDIAHSRTGDKGNISNISLIAYDPKDYALLKERVTAERVKEHFKGMVKGEVVRYELPNIHALNFVMYAALGGGVTRSLSVDMHGKGVTRFSPLAAWSHEHVLAYIHYHQLPLPPIYGWKNGYLCGTHPWPARQWTGSPENGWREVYDIDPSIVIEAAEKIGSARAFLEGVRV